MDLKILRAFVFGLIITLCVYLPYIMAMVFVVFVLSGVEVQYWGVFSYMPYMFTFGTMICMGSLLAIYGMFGEINLTRFKLIAITFASVGLSYLMFGADFWYLRILLLPGLGVPFIFIVAAMMVDETKAKKTKEVGIFKVRLHKFIIVLSSITPLLLFVSEHYRRAFLKILRISIETARRVSISILGLNGLF